MKSAILCVGNSFSQDATRYLEAIASACGDELTVRNCYIGGCSLEMHRSNLLSEEPLYELQKDGECVEMISLENALSAREWDFVTVQQVSYLAGERESYEPYLEELIAGIRLIAPRARIAMHGIWGYERGCGHPEFGRYGCGPVRMAEAIETAVSEAAVRYSLPIIASGRAIRRAQENPAFDPERGGVSLYRDGYHLSLDSGRYLAGLVWYSFFTGKAFDRADFAPEGTEPALIRICREAAAG